MGGSLINGLNIALSGLEAQQAVLDVAGNNVANASTAGYAAEQADLTPVASPSATNASQTAEGVTVAKVTRASSRFLQLQQWDNTSQSSDASAQSQMLSQVEAFFNEPSDTGLQSAMDAFWGDWEAVSSQPTSTAARTTLLSQAQGLTAQFNTLGAQLTGFQQSINSEVSSDVSQVNQLASGIAQLNTQIAEAQGSGAQPGGLADQRDSLVSQLAALAPVKVTWGSADQMTIAVGGVNLVAGSNLTKLQTAMGPGGNIQISWSGGEGAANITGGSIGAMLNLQNQVVGGNSGYIAQVNNLASALVSQVNAQQQAGYDLNGNPGVAFFSGDSANSIALNSGLANQPDRVAAASTASGVPGDGSNATAVANLQNAQVSQLGAMTFTNYYASTIGALGSAAEAANTQSTNLQAVGQSISTQLQSATGVSINTDLTQILEAQDAYQASAKVTETISSMLGDLIQSV